ncbi:MAG TPA: hypothetical protein VK485_10480 [Sphingomicrobium sp.]|nr:hypothetical protein [Sphingomicrobium sp.]
MNEQTQSAVPVWFWIAAALALLFECLGCYFYLAEVMMTDAQIAALPIDQGAMLAARPAIYYAAFAVAVWLGLLGTLLLLMRRKLAETVLLVSLIAVVAQFGTAVLTPAMSEVTPDSAYALPIAIAVICYGIYMLARTARQRGWLR